MGRSFDLVDAKVAQANFFLGRLARAEDPFEFHCFQSAFVASCRSVTYVLQAVMAKTPGFNDWYSQQQERLGKSGVSQYFNSLRSLDQHVGVIVLGRGRIESKSFGTKDLKYSFADPDEQVLPHSPGNDVLRACHTYYDEVVQVVADCCVDFRIPVDPKVHFTQMNFESFGQTLSDAMEEVLGDAEASLPYLHGTENQWLLLRELVWSTDLRTQFEHLLPKDDVTENGLTRE